jgi:hypothetical protein
MTWRPRWGMMVVAGLVAAALAAVGSTVFPRHPRSPSGRLAWMAPEDPSVAGAGQDAATLLQYVNDTLQSVGAQRIAEAGTQLSVLKLVSVPPSLRQLVDRVGREVGDLSSGMREVDAAIAEAETLLRARRPAEARRVLIQAQQLLRRNGAFVQQNRQTLLELADRLGIAHLPGGSPARRTFERIQQALNAVDARNRQITGLLGRIQKGEQVSLGLTSTSVQWTAPARAYPARPFVVSGIVTTAGRSNLPRQLVFDLDDRLLARLWARGSFRVALTPPADFPSGWHALTVLVKATREHDEFTETRPLALITYPITVEIDPVRRAWLPGAVTITGRATSQFGPLRHARVEVHLGSAAGTAKATSDGRFRVAVTLPFALDLVGTEHVQINVFPAAPWEEPGEAETRARFVNFWGLGLVCGVVPLAAVYVGTRRRRMWDGEAAPLHRMVDIPDDIVDVVGSPVQRAENTPRSPYGVDASTAARLIRIYATDVREIEEKKGVRFRPHLTMREFQRAAVQVLKGPTFVRMTALAELALYSSQPVTEDHVETMRRLSEDLDEELRDPRA